MTSKQKVVHYSKLCYQNKFVSAYEGNLSIRAGKSKIFITASHTCKGSLRESDIVTVDFNGKPVVSAAVAPGLRTLREPSKELVLHKYIYQHRSDVNAVIHTHPVFSTAFATAGLGLDKMVFPEIIFWLKKIPLAEYGLPTTDEIAQSLKDYVMDCDAVLLQNHGLVAYGSTLDDAYFKTEQVEHTASISFYARLLGGEKELTESQIEKLRGL
jgi:L-fuculose-phosphate aldolase